MDPKKKNTFLISGNYLSSYCINDIQKKIIVSAWKTMSLNPTTKHMKLAFREVKKGKGSKGI